MTNPKWPRLSLMLEQLSNRVYRWVEGARGGPEESPIDGTVMRCIYQNVRPLALIDPLEMAEGEALALGENLPAVSHYSDLRVSSQRRANKYRKRWGSTLLANDVERERYTTALDGWFSDGDTLLETIRCVLVPGGFYPETALLRARRSSGAHHRRYSLRSAM